MLLTLNQMTAICPAITGVRGQNIVDTINRVSKLYGMNTYGILEEFIPNLLVECGEFTIFEESLNYSAVSLRAKFGQHRISDAQCKLYGRIDGKQKANKVMIANTLYGGNWGKINLGNIPNTNDGWDLRGSGAMQLTGRYLMAKFTNYYNRRFETSLSMLEVVTRLRDIMNLDMSIHAACWIFSVEKELIDEAVANKIIRIRERINGGRFGIEDILKFYERCKKVLK